MPATSELLSRFINRKRSLQGIDFGIQNDAVSRLQLFNLSGIDYQGQASSGYGHQGLNVKIRLTLDLFDFLFPLIPLPGLSAGVSLDTTGDWLKEHFVLIQRFPQALYRYHRATNPRTGQLETVARPVWTTTAPICLLGLEGNSGSVKLGAGVSGGAQIPFPALGDELGIDVSVTADASVGLTGKFIRLREAYTGAFPSPADVNLGFHSGLEQVVENLFSYTDRPLQKQQIDDWIADIVNNWLRAKQPPSTPQGSGQPKSGPVIKERKRDFFKRQLSKIPLAAASEAVQSGLNEWVFSLVNLELRLPVFSSLLSRWQSQPSTGSLLDKLDQLRVYILQTPTDPQNFPQAEKMAALRQIQAYVTLLKKSYSRIDPPAAPGLVQAEGSLFNLFSFSGGANAAAGVTAAAGVELPLIPGAGIAIAASGGVGALANASVDIQRIACRYQSRLVGGTSPLFFTQDTWITYRRTTADASAFAQVDLAPLSYEQQVSRQMFYQSMSYVSTALYWTPTTSPYVIPEQRSGLRIGMSVAVRRLIHYARAQAAGQPVTLTGQPLTNISGPIIRNLAITQLQFDQFLVGAQFATLDENQEGFPKYVFLEAAFRFPAGFPVYLKDNRQEPKSTGPKRMLGDRQNLNGRLESLRLRIRMSDVETNQTPLFKLGFPLIRSRMDIDLSRVRGAGQEGMFDYYVYWYGNPVFNTDPAQASLAQETAIPPVLLLHQ